MQMTGCIAPKRHMHTELHAALTEHEREQDRPTETKHHKQPYWRFEAAYAVRMLLF